MVSCLGCLPHILKGAQEKSYTLMFSYSNLKKKSTYKQTSEFFVNKSLSNLNVNKSLSNLQVKKRNVFLYFPKMLILCTK